MSSKRTILHADANSFFASVECVYNPKLKHIPMAVGGDASTRHGIILAKNKIAKKYNIQTAETIHSAKKKCPDLVIVPPHHELYKEYSRKIFEIYTKYTDLVEPFGLDEAWLDVTGSMRLFGDGITIANKLRDTVKSQLGLTLSVGVSFCKVFAKLGSDYKKPDATTVFDEKNWKKFIFPLPVSDLLFVGKNTTSALEKIGIKTIGQLATADRKFLTQKFGKHGETLYIYANGLDNSPVKSICEPEDIKSIGNSTTFPQDIFGEEKIRREISLLSRTVATRMHKKNLRCNTIQVQIRNPQFKIISRQRTLDTPISTARELRDISMEIIKECWNMCLPIRLLGVTATNLVSQEEFPQQISLFEPSNQHISKLENLEKTVEALNRRFGENVFVNLNDVNRNSKKDI